MRMDRTPKPGQFDSAGEYDDGIPCPAAWRDCCESSTGMVGALLLKLELPSVMPVVGGTCRPFFRWWLCVVDGDDGSNCDRASVCVATLSCAEIKFSNSGVASMACSSCASLLSDGSQPGRSFFTVATSDSACVVTGSASATWRDSIKWCKSAACRKAVFSKSDSIKSSSSANSPALALHFNSAVIWFSASFMASESGTMHKHLRKLVGRKHRPL